MIRFIDTRNQGICANFAWFDTVSDTFETHGISMSWANWAEFANDYEGDYIDKYHSLVPDWAHTATLETVDDEFYRGPSECNRDAGCGVSKR